MGGTPGQVVPVSAGHLPSPLHRPRQISHRTHRPTRGGRTGPRGPGPAHDRALLDRCPARADQGRHSLRLGRGGSETGPALSVPAAIARHAAPAGPRRRSIGLRLLRPLLQHLRGPRVQRHGTTGPGGHIARAAAAQLIPGDCAVTEPAVIGASTTRLPFTDPAIERPAVTDPTVANHALTGPTIAGRPVTDRSRAGSAVTRPASTRRLVLERLLDHLSHPLSGALRQ